MTAVRDHYENLLAKRYSRIMGGFSAMVAANSAYFAERGVIPRSSGRALDLGAGSGFQAVPLAQAGFAVTALDISPTLVAELAERGRGLAIEAVQGDVRALAAHAPASFELVVCMGDVLAHLDSPAEAAALLGRVYELLEDRGLVILSFRDQKKALTGLDRFLPVYSDPDCVFTCFLEYGPERVEVTDLAYVRGENGWTLEKSSYRKIRLFRESVLSMLGSAGFRLEREDLVRGMTTVLARKTA